MQTKMGIPFGKANVQTQGTKREKRERNLTLFKGLLVQVMLEMPPLDKV